jgi:diguanylate cyclase (GGDEF)-like protein
MAHPVRAGLREAASPITPAVRIPIALGLLILIGQVAGVPGTSWATQDSWLFACMLLAGSALCAGRAVRHAEERAVWTLFALATCGYSLGYVYWALFLGPNQPYPSPADGFWLSLYPLMFVAICMLGRARLRGIGARVWLDGVIVGLGLAALSASVVFEQVAANTEGDTLAVVTTLAYPAGDLVLLVMIVVLFSAARTVADRSCQMLAAAVAVLLLTDSIWFVEVSRGTYAVNGVLDLGWPLAMILIGAAAWQRPRLRKVAADEHSIALPVVMVTGCVGLMTYDHFAPINALGAILAAATLLAVVIRLILTYRMGRELLRVSNHASLTDELTQIGNRAKLLRDLGIAREDGRSTLLAFFDLDGFKNYNDTFGHPAGDALLMRLAGRFARSMPPGAEAYRMGGDEFCALIPSQGSAVVTDLVAAACDALSEQGEGFSVTTSWGHALIPIEASTDSQALSIADRRLYEDKTSGRVSAQRQSQQVLSRVLEQRDHLLGIHIDDVAALARLTALELDLDDSEVERVVLTAELHDIGKSAIPDAILFKPGRLDADEFAFMKRHTIIGERIISGAPSLGVIAGNVRSTHERFDGRGYPDGLAGEAIPLAARIVFVCDAFDAMTSQRVYCSAVTSDAALTELRACAGTQFDPRVVEAFVRTRALQPVA